MRIEWKKTNFDGTDSRLRTFKYPQLFPEVLDNDKYWEVVRTLRVDFIPQEIGDELVIDIVSLAVNSNNLPILGSIHVKDNKVTMVKLFTHQLKKYKVAHYIDDVIATALEPLDVEDVEYVSAVFAYLIPEIVEKRGKYVLIVERDFQDIYSEFIDKQYSGEGVKSIPIPAFENATEQAFSRNVDDEVIFKLIDLTNELRHAGFINVWYHFGDSQEPLFVLEIPENADVSETGWIILTRYKNRGYNILAYLVNSDYVKPLPRDVAEGVIEYYNEVLDSIAKEKAIMIKHILTRAGIEPKDKKELEDIIEVIEEEFAYDGFEPGGFEDEEFIKLAQTTLKKIKQTSITTQEVLSTILPLTKRQLKRLHKEYGFE